MKFKATPKAISKVADYGTSGSLIALQLLADKLGYTSYRYGKINALFLLASCCKEINTFLVAKFPQAFKIYPEAFIKLMTLTNTYVNVTISSSNTYSLINRAILLTAVNILSKDGNIGILAGATACVFLTEAIRRKILNNYQYQEVNHAEPDDMIDCSKLKNNLLIVYFSFLGATVFAASSLSANLFMHKFAETISDIITPIPTVGKALCLIATSPMLYSTIFQKLAYKALSCTDYTHEAYVIPTV